MLTFLGSGADGLSQLLIQDHASWLDSVGDTDRIGIAIIVSGKRNPNAINAGILRGLFFSARNVCLIVYRRACSKNKPGGCEYGCPLFHRLRQSGFRFMKPLINRLLAGNFSAASSCRRRPRRAISDFSTRDWTGDRFGASPACIEARSYPSLVQCQRRAYEASKPTAAAIAESRSEKQVR
jgi:hypothetical protein